MTEFNILQVKVKLFSLRTYLLSILDDGRLTAEKRKEYLNLCDNLKAFSDLSIYYESEIKNLNDINLDLCKTNLELMERIHILAEENKHLKANVH